MYANELGHIRRGSLGALLLLLFNHTEGSKSTKQWLSSIGELEQILNRGTQTRHSWASPFEEVAFYTWQLWTNLPMQPLFWTLQLSTQRKDTIDFWIIIHILIILLKEKRAITRYAYYPRLLRMAILNSINVKGASSSVKLTVSAHDDGKIRNSIHCVSKLLTHRWCPFVHASCCVVGRTGWYDLEKDSKRWKEQ